MLFEFAGRLCQAPTSMFVQWRFTETPYNDLIVHTFCFKARRCA